MPAPAELVAKHGRTATSFRARSSRLQWWSAGEHGGVAFAELRHAWVAAGEPVAARENVVPVADEFRAEAARARKRVVFFATEGAFARRPGYARLHIGEQPYWDPSLWPAKLAHHRSLREQLRRARAKGVRVRESLEPAEREDAARGRGPLAGLLARWTATRPMATMHFLVHPEPFDGAPARRLFVAERDAVPVALLSLVPMGGEGWLGEHLVRAPDAPNGASELLVDAAMRTVGAEGARFVSLGLAPLGGDVPWWLRVARVVSRPLFNFRGLTAFKRKLDPDEWRPIYMVYPAEASVVRSLVDSLRAFAEGSLLRFFLETLRRTPEWSLRLLEWMLLPWTIALAAVPTDPWFPSVRIHAAWVIFDLALWGLLRMRRQGHRAGITGLAAAVVAIDAVVTAWQALVWDLPHVPGATGIAVVALSILAPAIASSMLWRAARRERAIFGRPATPPRRGSRHALEG